MRQQIFTFAAADQLAVDFDFNQFLPDPTPRGGWNIIVRNIALELNDIAQVFDYWVRFAPLGAADVTVRHTIRQETGGAGFALLGYCYPVPVDADGSWRLLATSTLKTEEASVIVDFTVEPR